ncbi:hypothetical protein Pdsh_10080 [Pyrodictium delaneyi]|uniref:Uncharacterized protein n=1 Tax=Pyrodictium delaneyi TaxID=1273541 RepID=A0A211YLL3_9CREN|nr:hypothetical protein Pdsh_10080 [Pyrodictium delaneyi]
MATLLQHYGISDILSRGRFDLGFITLGIVNVYVEGDCKLFRKFMKRIKERLNMLNVISLETVFEVFMSDAKRCVVRLMWNEVIIEVEEAYSSSRFQMIARGVPLDVLLVIKDECVRHLAMKAS